MIVAIDGPAGSGKSTVARALAAREGFTYLDTGAMYRAVTWACLEQGVDVQDEQAVSEFAQELNIVLQNGQSGPTVSVNGVDCTAAIRTPEVDANVSAVAAISAVRSAMVDLQRSAAQTGNVVAEGRDIGTVVFPEAEVKVFLVADPAARALRRAVQREGGDLSQGGAASEQATAEAKAIEAELIERDRKDSTRKVAPLVAAADAHEINSTYLSVDEVVNTIVGLIAEAQA